MRSFVFSVLVLASVPCAVFGGGMEVDIYVHKDKFGKSLTLDIGDSECTNVPRLWANLTQSVDTHGSCMQFYEGKNCKGRIAVIQPFHTVHQMDLSLINFHNTIQSVSPCGAKVPSGRYVIQSAVDASMLTVHKIGNDFATVNTLPPQSFIPKAQQWEISEKQSNEYDVSPRIHETNYPVTYDGDSMKKGSFIRKVWKIESVGRGRYIIKSEWTQKCLYKTRIRTVEEHDCRAWSPNQEWVLRPLIAPTKAPPTQDPQLADGVNFQVPSRIVDRYLEEQKRLREKTKQTKNKGGVRNGAFLEPYKIRHRKKPSNSQQEQSSEEDADAGSSTSSKYRKTPLQVQDSPPGPEIMYTRPAPLFPYDPRPHGKLGQKVLAYMDGVAPIYEDVKMEDPTFPDFLLHASSPPEIGDGPRYQVTRTPIHEPTGHPDYVPPKKKYDGRVKDEDYEPPQPKKDEESGEEDDTQSEEDQSDENQSEEEKDDEKAKPTVIPVGYFAYDGSPLVHDITPSPVTNVTSTTPPPTDGDNKSEESEEGDNDEDDTSQEDEKKEDSVPTPEEEDIDLGDDDPARDVAGFMKLLFQGINNRITKTDTVKNTVNDLLKRKK